MPELPEVETVTRALKENILHQTITKWHFHRKDLRFPIPTRQLRRSTQEVVGGIQRRGKYMQISLPSQNIQIHLGMSGVILFSNTITPPLPHTHISIEFNGGEFYMHYVDPRRFGFFLSFHKNEDPTPQLGPEPLEGTPLQLAKHLHSVSSGRKTIVKSFLLNQKNVAGLGNIYICECLFRAQVHPETLVHTIELSTWRKISKEIRAVLNAGIKAGGTTLKDFRSTDSKPGYFAQKLLVYGREDEACKVCSKKIRRVEHSNRSTFYCATCQTLTSY